MCQAWRREELRPITCNMVMIKTQLGDYIFMPPKLILFVLGCRKKKKKRYQLKQHQDTSFTHCAFSVRSFGCLKWALNFYTPLRCYKRPTTFVGNTATLSILKPSGIQSRGVRNLVPRALFPGFFSKAREKRPGDEVGVQSPEGFLETTTKTSHKSSHINTWRRSGSACSIAESFNNNNNKKLNDF